MIERFRNVFDIKAHAVSGVVIAFIHSVDPKTAADLFLVALNVAYIVWRWRREAKANKPENLP